MVLGALFLIESPFTGMGVRLPTALAVVIPFSIIVIILMRLVMKSRKWKVSTGAEELVGEFGEVTEPVGAAGNFGMVFVHGELWRAAASDGQPIPKGARIRVARVKGLTLEVEPSSAPQSASS
jgi:membrane-bound serine protease (ClpP class)